MYFINSKGKIRFKEIFFVNSSIFILLVFSILLITPSLGNIYLYNKEIPYLSLLYKLNNFNSLNIDVSKAIIHLVFMIIGFLYIIKYVIHISPAKRDSAFLSILAYNIIIIAVNTNVSLLGYFDYEEYCSNYEQREKALYNHRDNNCI